MPVINPDPTSQQISSRRNHPMLVSHARKLRSKIQRRKRIPLLPIINNSWNALFEGEDEAESSSSGLHSEISCNSSLVFAGSEGLKKRPRLPRLGRENKAIGSFRGEFPGEEFRRITRSYSRQKERLISEESKEIGSGVLPGSRSDAKRSKPEETEVNTASEVAISEISQASGSFSVGNLKKKAKFSETIEKFPEVSESSCLESVSEANAVKIPKSPKEEGSRSEISQNFVISKEKPYDLDLESDLACSEQLSYDSEYSTCNEMTLSEFESELFNKCSEEDFSDYSPSLLDDSADDFSERSRENSAPSASFAMFLQFTQQFLRSSSRAEAEARTSFAIDDEYSDEFTLMRFEVEEDEESYKRFRSRERNHVILHDYAEEYDSTTEYGDLILEQRLLMVNWIVEHSNALELQCETLFLGVNLLDRFLSRGYFESQRNLQLLGIACVTLATRIEENQPYNSIRQRSFKVGSNVYSRCEVVAMEWLVQEVLNFKCFLPTTFNFLWFYLKAARADAEVENLARYLAVLSLLDHERLCFWPSTVAAGVVILASLAANRDSSCQSVMETHVRTKNDDLPECIQSLEWLVKYVC